MGGDNIGMVLRYLLEDDDFVLGLGEFLVDDPAKRNIDIICGTLSDDCIGTDDRVS